MELRCNCFAAEFLAPEAGVRKMFRERAGSGINADVLLAVEVSRHYGISWEAAKTRLLDLFGAQLRPSLKDWSRSRAANLAGDWEEPREGSEIGEVLPPPIYLNAALDAYVRGRANVHDLARIFRTDDASALQRDLAEAGWVPESALAHA
jgi:hypothetical protein